MTTTYEWTLGDRMRKSLRNSGKSAQDVAAELGVSRTSVSAWLSDKHRPGPPVLKLWSQITECDPDWLITGTLPRLDSNQQPSGYATLQSGLLDPDCRDGKHNSCVGAPCSCECHEAAVA